MNKCSDHVPLYRSEDILVRHGLHVPRSTLCDGVHRSTMLLLLLLLVAFMMIRVLQQPVLWMAVPFTIVANAKRHHLDPYAYVRDLLLRMSALYADSGVEVPDFTQVPSAEFRALGMSLATQLSSEALTAMLPDHWAMAHPEHVLVHRIDEARQVADRKRDRREQRRVIRVVSPAASQ